MRIYIMRHGEAENFAPSDAERPLTQRGRSQSVQVATQLHERLNQQPIDWVWVSPYLRAQQTWQTLADVLSEPKQISTVADITPYGEAEEVAAYLKAAIDVERPESVLLVSHLPLVGYLTAELDPSIQPPMFRTSAIAALEYNPETGRAEFLWQDVPQ
ncbi:phosphohistidine phosphatase SixA [Photobacterium damselae]|uniref:phosphohistidine phosphatase SixA n=1 Tax=Photobacterium damselae TaxID=38293 RepID=UPI0040695720